MSTTPVYVQKGFIPGVDILDEPTSLFVIQVMTILTVCGILTVFGQYFKQPSVIFSIIGGIILGPSCLARNAQSSYVAAVIPSFSLGTLKVIATFGLQIYLFVVGLELDLTEIKTQSMNMGVIALSGMILPFCMGIAVAVLLYKTYFNQDDANTPSFSTFSVFIGTCMAVTALPVLARILKENNLMNTVPGSVALSAAVITDAIAWILLVVSICLATASDSSVAGWVFFSIIMYIALLLTVGRIALREAVKFIEDRYPSQIALNNLFTATVIMFLLSGWLVQQIGIDPIVGTFAFGVIVPRESRLYTHCVITLENFVVTILLPIYFAISGIKTDLTQMKDTDLPILILIIVIAVLTKFFGAGIPALLLGHTPLDASVIAVLMNTKGLVELIVLNIGLTYHVLNVRIFSIMVVMCLFTTFMTCPILVFLYPENIRTYIADAVPTFEKDLGENKQSELEMVEAGDSHRARVDSEEVEHVIPRRYSNAEAQSPALKEASHEHIIPRRASEIRNSDTK